MKNISFLTLITIILLFLPLTTALTTSNDDYAVEVVLNKPGTIYNSYNLDKIQNLKIQNNKHTAPSQYSPNLAAIFNYETGLTSGTSTGLSVRLQLPTKTSEIKTPFINFVSLIDNAKLSEHDDFHLGWEITCANQKCQLSKQETELTITQISKNRYEIIIESNELSSSGKKCFIKYGNTLCTSSKLEADISSVLSHIGFVSSFNELLISYTVVSIGNKVVSSLVPDTNLKPDWQEAMRQELVNLKRKNIINIEDKEIEEIARLTQQGKAGKNNRIIYNSDSESYDYYYKTTLPILTQELNSEPFTFLTANVAANPISNPYYFVPLILTAAFIIIAIILIITARIISREKRKKRLHPTGLLSQG